MSRNIEEDRKKLIIVNWGHRIIPHTTDPTANGTALQRLDAIFLPRKLMKRA